MSEWAEEIDDLKSEMLQMMKKLYYQLPNSYDEVGFMAFVEKVYNKGKAAKEREDHGMVRGRRLGE